MSYEKIITEEQAKSVQWPYINHWSKQRHSPEYCCAAVHDGGRSVGFHQCSFKPKHWYGSLGYCTKHDPNNVLAERHRRDEEYRGKLAEYNAKLEASVRARLFAEACEAAVRSIAAGHNDPRSLCLEILEQFKAPE